MNTSLVVEIRQCNLLLTALAQRERQYAGYLAFTWRFEAPGDLYSTEEVCMYTPHLTFITRHKLVIDS